MLISTRNIYGSTVSGSEGDIGTVRDILFDDVTWEVKYLAVHTGGRLAGENHLLSPKDIDRPEWMGHRLLVHLNTDQVEHCPTQEEHPTDAQQREKELSKLIAWEAYWTGLFDQSAEENNQSHLDSTKEVAGYTLRAKDGAIGHVKDFIIDDASWHIRYLTVDTRHWLPGKHVLVFPASIRSFSLDQQMIAVDLHRDQIQASPAYDRKIPIDQEYEKRLFAHYRLPENRSYQTA